MNDIFSKKNLKDYYNEEAGFRNSKPEDRDWKIEARNKFYSFLTQEGKKTLLELGAGTGHDSCFFMNNGMEVTAVDFSSEMAVKCREKGIETYEMDYYNLSSIGRSFDCVYTMNTLLHVPKKDLPHVFNEISAVINPDGLFYLGLYGGADTEKELVNEISDIPRYYAFHSENLIRSIATEYFRILDFETIDISDRDAIDIFHSVRMRKI